MLLLASQATALYFSSHSLVAEKGGPADYFLVDFGIQQNPYTTCYAAETKDDIERQLLYAFEFA